MIEMFIPTLNGIRKHPTSLGISARHSNPSLRCSFQPLKNTLHIPRDISETIYSMIEMFIPTLNGIRKHPTSLAISARHSNPSLRCSFQPSTMTESTLNPYGYQYGTSSMCQDTPHGAAEHLILSDKFIRVLISTPF